MWRVATAFAAAFPSNGKLVIGFVEAALASEELDEARFADPFLPPTPRAKPQTAHDPRMKIPEASRGRAL
jgi:hypothetical protein